MEKRRLSKSHVKQLVRGIFTFLIISTIAIASISAVLLVPYWVSFIPHTIPVGERGWVLGHTNVWVSNGSGSWTSTTTEQLIGLPYARWLAGIGDIGLLIIFLVILAIICEAIYAVYDWLFPVINKQPTNENPHPKEDNE